MTRQTELLERKITAAFSNPNAGSEELVALIDDVDRAARYQESVVDQVSARSIEDLSVDIETANTMVVSARLQRDRFLAAIPRLRDKAKAAASREIEERWAARAARLQAKIGPLAAEFRDTYSPAVETLLSLFVRIRELEAEVAQCNAQAPPGQHVLGVELTARGMTSFSTKESSVILGTVLLDPSDSHQLWPPVSVPLSVIAAAAQPVLAGPSGDWRTDLV
jgi:hypothetical protein